MIDKAKRREMIEAARRTPPPAGVYRYLNRSTGRSLVRSSPNLDGARGRFEFAATSGNGDALDDRLRADLAEFGIASFAFEVLDTLTVESGTDPQQMLEDLAELEALWRERFEPADLY